ncbi:4-carboxy-4-hydroxy-2-oxoadipate aldolase/oxaloacetate decarboxylase [Ilumatobacter sp.]|jgi:4-hydroxy-4-methyl-2-oxoglutarate aldolase|uniref:4-carboxy-4-hydroxy-2-oxoadipate aldolase/oxaloacetate decarboxylase n=1 Tax=Ilumatobacter sp. TaxID=1967498 RepID=UPI0030A00AB0|tara:strand:- start:128 stop:808 length:681 start_codon:yes stop_codon:yes gene_type:complete
MNKHVIIRNIERAESSIIDRLGAAGAATVHEAIGRVGYVGPHLKPIQADTKIAGSAVTVLSHPGDNIMIHAAVEMCQPGDVLVVANTAPSTHGMFGDLFATSLMARGVRGLVIDAGVRDTADLRSMGFPVWSQHVSCQGTVKNTPGSVNVPVVLGGVTVQPGDVVCADDDGVVIVARVNAAWALERTDARLAKEEQMRATLASGALGVDVYALRQRLIDMGVEYID